MLTALNGFALFLLAVKVEGYFFFFMCAIASLVHDAAILK